LSEEFHWSLKHAALKVRQERNLTPQPNEKNIHQITPANEYSQKMISDKNLARIAGFCYLIVMATGLFSEVYPRKRIRKSIPDPTCFK
jgi:hypothetical protein